MGASNTTVTWQVNGVTGGNSTVGTITAAGVYRAPARPPAPSTLQVSALLQENTAKIASATVTIADASASGPPTIAGAPLATIVAGHHYRFDPTVVAARGARLAFSIANKPAWASFDSATGTLYGTPMNPDQGTFANVAISVSDGMNSAALSPFTITVQPGTFGSVTLSWQSPTTRTDGTPLTNLAGFRIYYGDANGVYPDSISVPNPGVSTYVVSNVPGGAYYFVATAYDASGAESDYSEVASKTIR